MKKEVQVCSSVDYLTLTIHISLDQQWALLDMFGMMKGLAFSGGGGHGYKELWKSEVGLQVLRLPAKSEGEFFTIEFSGSGVMHYGIHKIMELITFCQVKGIRYNCTRIDLAIDQNEFTTKQFARCVDKDEVKTYVRRTVKGSFDFHKGLDINTDATQYVGSPKSDKRLRVYQKQIEGHELFGDEYFTRIELQLRGDSAKAALFHLMTFLYADWHEQMVGIIRRFVDLEKKWWLRVMTAPPVRIALQQTQSSIEKIDRWLHEQVLPSLATYLAAIASPGLELLYLEQLLKKGRERMTVRHLAMIEVFDERLKPDYSPIYV